MQQGQDRRGIPERPHTNTVFRSTWDILSGQTRDPLPQTGRDGGESLKLWGNVLPLYSDGAYRSGGVARWDENLLYRVW